MMDITELAHWRYRIPALQAELRNAEGLQEILARWRYQPRLDKNMLPVWEPKPPSEWELESIQKCKLIRWLIEEAKYKVQLGELGG
jgi:hypothetical protein